MIPTNIYTLLQQDPCMTILVDLIDIAGLREAVQTLRCATLFAPNNAAFKKLPPELIAFLVSPEGKPTLIDILLYHVTNGRQFTEKLYNGQKLNMLNNQQTTVNKNGNNICIIDSNGDCSKIYNKNNTTQNCSLVQKICSVLIPNLPAT